MSMIRVGTGAGMGDVAPITPGTAYGTGLDRFTSGAKVWLSPSQAPAALAAIWERLKAAPGATLTDPLVLGFLAVPAAAILALVWGMKAAKRRRTRNPGRRRVMVRRGRRRVANPRRRNPGRRKPLYWVAYGMSPSGGTQMARTKLAAAIKAAERIAAGGGVSTVWRVDPYGAKEMVYHASPARTVLRKQRARLSNPSAKSTRRKIRARRKVKGPRKKNPGRRAKSRGTHRAKNGGSWVSWGHSVPPGYTPGPGRKFQLGGRFGVVKSVYRDEDGDMWVQFRRAVDGTTGMSLGNFRQAAYIE